MVWRRLLVLDTCTLLELHGVIQVAMRWEGIHLYGVPVATEPKVRLSETCLPTLLKSLSSVENLRLMQAAGYLLNG